MTTLVFKHPGPQKVSATCLLTRQHGGDHSGEFCLKLEQGSSSIEVYIDAKKFADLLSSIPRENDVFVIGDIRKDARSSTLEVRSLPASIRSTAQQHLQYGSHLDTCKPLVNYLKVFARKNGFTNCYAYHHIDNRRNITITLTEIH